MDQNKNTYLHARIIGVSGETAYPAYKKGKTMTTFNKANLIREYEDTDEEREENGDERSLEEYLSDAECEWADRKYDEWKDERRRRNDYEKI